MNSPQKTRLSVKAASFADAFSNPPFRISACSAAFLLCLGVLSVPAIAQPTPVNISTGEVNYHVCGNGTGATGDGDCGAPDPSSFDDSAAATTGNAVSITNDASVRDPFTSNGYNVYGAYNDGTGDRAVEGNGVTINTTGEVDGAVLGGFAKSDDADSKAKDNWVTFIDGRAANGGITGGYASSDSGIAHADHNTVEISGGEADHGVLGGRATASQGESKATNNHLILSNNAQVGDEASGGYSDSGTGRASVSGNYLTISGSATVGSDAHGGYAGGYIDSTATDNHVTISGSADVSRDAIGSKHDHDFRRKRRRRILDRRRCRRGRQCHWQYGRCHSHGQPRHDFRRNNGWRRLWRVCQCLG